MEPQPRQLKFELLDGAYLLGTVAFVGWAAATQPAALSAPTTAIFTATLLVPNVRGGLETFAQQFHRTTIAIGTILTAFLWMLSTTQSTTYPLPSDITQATVILIGWLVATTYVITSPFIVLAYRLTNRGETTHSGNGRNGDYVIGMFSATLAGLLLVFMFVLSKDLLGIKLDLWFAILYMILVGPAVGWFIVATSGTGKRSLPTEHDGEFETK